MTEEFNLRNLRRLLNEGESYYLVYCGKSPFPVEHDCILINEKINTDIEKDSNIYCFINNIVTPDKKELLLILKMLNVGIKFEKIGENIETTLIMRQYTDPMNLLRDYYNLPIISIASPKLKKNIHYLNKALIDLNLTNDLVGLSKKYHPASEYHKYFNFDLEEDHKSLKLVRKENNKEKIDEEEKGLPF